jgi:outer membrane protein
VTSMRTLSALLLLTMTLTSQSAFARTLTLEECVQLVMERNSGLKSSQAESSAASEDATIAQAALLPSLKLKSFYTLVDKSDRLLVDTDRLAPGVPPQKTSLSLGETSWYGMGIVLRQPLFTGGNLIGTRQQTRHEAAAAAFAHSRQGTLLRFQVKKAFNEALIAANRTQAAERDLQANEERLKVSVARQQEGYADREEVLRREANLAMSQARLVRARNRSFLGLSKLRQLAGYGPDEAIEVVGKPAKLKLTAGLAELTGGSAERREDIRSASEKNSAAQSGVQVARSAFFPQVYLEGAYLRQKETPIARPELWSLTVQAEWSLFEWGRTSATVRKALAQASQLDLAREELSRSARLEIEQSWRDVIELESQVVAQEKGIKADEAGFDKIIGRFQEGAARFDEAVSAEAALWEAYDSYCQSAASLSSAFATLEAASSESLDQWTVSEDLYRPDFESYASRIRNQRSQVPTDGKAAPSPATAPPVAAPPVAAPPVAAPPVAAPPVAAPPVVAPPVVAPPVVAPPVVAPPVVAPPVAAPPVVAPPVAAPPVAAPPVTAPPVTAPPAMPHAEGLPSVALTLAAEPAASAAPNTSVATALAQGRTKKPARYLQLGAYVSKKRAKDVIMSLTPRLTGVRPEILAEGKFYKPVIGPFASSETARDAAKSLGITEYLIRSVHGS